jgi:hypothetical protein
MENQIKRIENEELIEIIKMYLNRKYSVKCFDL